MNHKEKETVKMGLVGFGKTGKIVAKEILLEKEAELRVVFRKKAKKKTVEELFRLNSDRKTPIFSMSNFEEKLLETNPEVIIDFSTPENVMSYLPILEKNKKKIVICSTGYTKEQKDILRQYAKKMPILWAPNITEGVNVLFFVAKLISRVWDESDIEITEMHHRDKKDISGTAKRISKLISEDRGGENKIPIHSLRFGGIVGKHTIYFGMPDQSISITHESASRNAFGKGAVRAADWISGKKAGFFSMEEVLNLDGMLKVQDKD